MSLIARLDDGKYKVVVDSPGNIPRLFFGAGDTLGSALEAVVREMKKDV